MKIITCLIISMMIGISSYAQYLPQKLIVEGDYIQRLTNLVFPSIIDNYDRSSVYSFDEKKLNIGVSYDNRENKGKTTFTVYVYPAGNGTEDRLRNEYQKSFKEISDVSRKKIHAFTYPVSFKNSGYKINGYKAEIIDLKLKSNLCVFECGRWFFKIRITSNKLDSAGLNNLEQKILEFFIPTNLVQKEPLNSKADIYFNKSAFIDSLMLGSAMGSAYSKISWAMENVDSLERAAGFPGLYLDLHVAALKGFVDFEIKNPDFSKSKRTEDYLSELNSIINSGFLKEFIMEQYNMIMITPDNLKLDFEGFHRWEIAHPVNINLQNKFYIISYSE